MLLILSGKKHVDVSLSIKFKKQFKCKERQCFYNSSSKLCQIKNDLKEPDIMYVEGYYQLDTIDAILIPHGWIQRTNGIIIDLTRSELNDEMLYYPVIKFKHAEMFSLIRKNSGRTPLHKMPDLLPTWESLSKKVEEHFVQQEGLYALKPL